MINKDEQTELNYIDNAVQPTGWYHVLPREQYKSLKRIDIDDAWFEVYQVSDGVFCIYEPGNFQEVLTYLIVGETRALLQDTGMGMGDMRAVVERLTSLPITVINTHCHFDHIGCNWQFEDGYFWPSAPSLSRMKIGQPHADVAYVVADDSTWIPYPAGFYPEQYALRPYPTWQSLSEGQLFELGGRTLRALHTPGHSPDSVMLADDENRILFTGDMVYPATMYSHMTSDDGMNSDFDTYRATMRTLANRYADYTLYTSHNEPMRPGTMLTAVADAFDVVANGAPYEIDEEGLRKYTFDGFCLVTANS